MALLTMATSAARKGSFGSPLCSLLGAFLPQMPQKAMQIDVKIDKEKIVMKRAD